MIGANQSRTNTYHPVGVKELVFPPGCELMEGALSGLRRKRKMKNGQRSELEKNLPKLELKQNRTKKKKRGKKINALPTKEENAEKEKRKNGKKREKRKEKRERGKEKREKRKEKREERKEKREKRKEKREKRKEKREKKIVPIAHRFTRLDGSFHCPSVQNTTHQNRATLTLKINIK